MSLLLQNGADIHAKDNRGWTAFHRALRGSNAIELLSILLDNGARINEGDLVRILAVYASLPPPPH